MYSTVIEHRVADLIKLGLFKYDYTVLVLVNGYEVLVKPTPDEGIEIYSDYSLGTKDFAIMHGGKTLEGFGTGFSVTELLDVLKGLDAALCANSLVIDLVNGPGVPLGRDRRSLTETHRRTVHHPGANPQWVPSSPFLNLKRTLDQWFAGKGNNG